MGRFDALPVLGSWERTARPKPSKLARQVAQYANRVESAKVARDAKRREAEAWRVIVEQVFARDKGRCRVCWRKVKGLTDDPEKRAHTHHVTYRSAGGTDDLWNLAVLCGRCHADEHEHRIAISGRADVALTITKHNQETGKVLRIGESVCPAAHERTERT